MSKKKAVGASHLVIDIPCGRGTKVKTIGDADLLSKDFIELGKRLGIKTQCAVTYGEQPIGHAIGPALEARERGKWKHNAKLSNFPCPKRRPHVQFVPACSFRLKV